MRSARLGRPAMVVHGGAGSFARPEAGGHGREIACLRAALDAGWAVLAGGGRALEAVVEAVATLEDDGAFNAGRGSVATTEGTVENDAAVMDGAGVTAGAVCAARWPASPVRAARALAAAGDAVMLAGAGADRFAAGAGLARREGAGGGAQPAASPPTGGADLPAHLGTVGAVAVDVGAHLAAATSTGGRPGQRPGRVGDTPIIGAGTWARDDTAAVSATGTGEAFVLAGFGHRVDWELRAGAALDEAASAALASVESWGGYGGAILIDAAGDAVVIFDTPAMARGWRHSGGQMVEVVGAGGTGAGLPGGGGGGPGGAGGGQADRR